MDNTINKLCLMCNTIKPASEFHKKKSNKDGLRNKCKSCRSILSKKNYKQNKEKIKNNSKLYRKNNKEKIKNTYKQNRQTILQKKKEYYQINKEKILLQKKENKQHFNILSNKYKKNKRKHNKLYKLTTNIRSLIYCSFKNKNITKNTKTHNILGCTFNEFKSYIEKQFDNNMNWNNYGSYWHLDHIKPVSLAKDEKELLKLNHYKNFQPLYWKDNLSKGNKY